MRWEGRRQSTNIEDRRGIRISRGGLVGGGIGTLAIALLVMFMGGDPSAILQMAGDAPVEERQVPHEETAEEKALREETQAVLASTEDSWQAIFGDMGGQYENPTLVFYIDAVESGCGVAPSSVGPFYCSLDRKVYLDLAFFNQLATQLGARGDFPRAYVVAHEVGHHVQNLTGTSGRVQELQQRDPGAANQLSVRLELQADCYAGIWANRAGKYAGVLEPGDIEEGLGAASAIGDDTLQRNAGQAPVPDSFTHGTAGQRTRWFTTGYRSGSVDACDTFKAADL